MRRKRTKNVEDATDWGTFLSSKQTRRTLYTKKKCQFPYPLIPSAASNLGASLYKKEIPFSLPFDSLSSKQLGGTFPECVCETRWGLNTHLDCFHWSKSNICKQMVRQVSKVVEVDIYIWPQIMFSPLPPRLGNPESCFSTIYHMSSLAVGAKRLGVLTRFLLWNAFSGKKNNTICADLRRNSAGILPSAS